MLEVTFDASMRIQIPEKSRDRLMSAIEELADKHSDPKRDFDLSTFVNRLLWMSIPAPPLWGSKKVLPRKNSLDELKKLRDKANELRVVMDSLHGPTVRELAGWGGYELRIWLMATDQLATDAIARLNGAPGSEGDATKLVGGRPGDWHTQSITRYAAGIYTLVTGKTPHAGGRYVGNERKPGPFIRFLEEIFEVLGIRRDSASSQARNYLRPQKKKTGEN
jgi:hypothetical protein